MQIPDITEKKGVFEHWVMHFILKYCGHHILKEKLNSLKSS